MNELVANIEDIVNQLSTPYQSVYFDRGLLSDLNKDIERNFPLFYVLPITATYSPIANGFSFTKSYTIRVYVVENTNDRSLDVNDDIQTELTNTCEILAENFLKLFNSNYNLYQMTTVSMEEIRGLADFTNYLVAGVLLTLTINVENFVDC